MKILPNETAWGGITGHDILEGVNCLRMIQNIAMDIEKKGAFCGLMMESMRTFVIDRLTVPGMTVIQNKNEK